MATTNDLKNGMVLNIDGNLWSVVEFQHVKPGKGGAFVRTKLKNVLSGKVVDRTFNAGSKVDTATVDKRDMQYLYKDGEDFVFMDSATYDQLHISAATVGDAAPPREDRGDADRVVPAANPVAKPVNRTGPGANGLPKRRFGAREKQAFLEQLAAT